MKKTTLFFTFILISLFANAQFTTGVVNLNFGMSVEIETQPSQVTLTLTGPNNKWFAIGFGGNQMAAVSDIFAYDGTNIFDKVGYNYAAPTNDNNQDWSIISNTVSGINRTIIATRPLSTGDADDYTFNNATNSTSIIYAHGSSMALEYHQNRDFTILSKSAVANINKIKKLQFAMYPNPVQTKLNIVLPSNVAYAKVEIYNVLGKKIYKAKLNTSFNKIDVSNIDSGIYLIKIIGNDLNYGIKQFVKN